MRLYKILIIILFIAVVAFAIYVNVTKTEDFNAPVLKCDKQVLSLSVKDDPQSLIKYVVAQDAKDGNISDKILVESISSFTKGNTAQATFAVCDSDNNVTKLKKTIRYVDYTPPVIKLKTPLIFFTGSIRIDLLSGVEATDILEGTISERVIVEKSDIIITDPGIYPVTFSVTTSKGITSKLTVNAYVYESRFSEKIELSDYVVYTKKGQEFDAMSVIDYYPEKYLNDENLAGAYDYELVIDDSLVDYEKPGTYYIEYRFERTYVSGRQERVDILAQTYLAVVVEG